MAASLASQIPGGSQWDGTTFLGRTPTQINSLNPTKAEDKPYDNAGVTGGSLNGRVTIGEGRSTTPAAAEAALNQLIAQAGEEWARTYLRDNPGDYERGLTAYYSNDGESGGFYGDNAPKWMGNPGRAVNMPMLPPQSAFLAPPTLPGLLSANTPPVMPPKDVLAGVPHDLAPVPTAEAGVPVPNASLAAMMREPWDPFRPDTLGY